MRIFKIKNKEIYNVKKGDNPEGIHFYAVYKDKKTGKYRAIQLTHVLEEKKEKQIKKGQLTLEKIKCIGKKSISGVHNQYYDKDINGKDLDFGRKTKHKKVGNVSSAQAKRIMKHARKKVK